MAPSAISASTAEPTTTSTSFSANAELQLQRLETPLKNLSQLSKDFEDIFHDLALNSTSQFLPTPVRALPSGEETGLFLALDLGGTNLRVGVVELFGGGPLPENSGYDLEGAVEVEAVEVDGSARGGRLRISTQGSWKIPEHLKSSAAQDLFTWVSERIGDVFGKYLAHIDANIRETTLAEGVELGITFSFPMEQTSHTSALLMPMGKGFTFTGTNELSALLTDAYNSHLQTSQPLPSIRIVSITNDAISTLLSAAYIHSACHAKHSRTAAGIIAGTGTNATCLCPASKLHQLKKPPVGETMLLNTEWSINGTSTPLEPYMTEWDRRLDAENEKPGFQPLEEMVGGRYLGELSRLVSLDIFATASYRLPTKMLRPYGVDTGLCGDVEAAIDDGGALELLREYFNESEDVQWDLQIAATFKRICSSVSTRAAALIAAATVGVLGMNDELNADSLEILIGYTGTILERYPGFKERCEGFMQEIIGRRADAGRKTVRLVEAKDGGILGAAVLAAMVKEGRT